MNKLNTPATLHSVNMTTAAQNASVQEQFSFRRNNGSSAVLKPVLNDGVILIMQNKLSSASEETRRSHVICFVKYLFNWSSNSIEQQPWEQSHKAIADLINDCLDVCVKVRVTDLIQRTNEFEEKYFDTLVKLCEITSFAAEQSAKLSERLLKKGASNFLKLICHVTGHLTSRLLLAFSSLCFHANRTCVREALQQYSPYVDCIGKRIVRYDADNQLSAYIILFKSLGDSNEAQMKAAKWFQAVPFLQNKFLQCFSRPIIEGSGAFMNEICELKSRMP